MGYLHDFDLCGTRERNGELRQEVQKLHLERRLRQNGRPRLGARLGAQVLKGTLPLLRKMTLAR